MSKDFNMDEWKWTEYDDQTRGLGPDNSTNTPCEPTGDQHRLVFI